MRFAERPEQVPAVLAARVADGAVDPVHDMYTEDAVLVLEPGKPLSGEPLREALVDYLEVGVPAQTSVRHALVSGDLALLIVDWESKGTARDGTRVELAATATDVVRRGSDGRWRYVIDNPFGVEGGE